MPGSLLGPLQWSGHPGLPGGLNRGQLTRFEPVSQVGAINLEPVLAHPTLTTLRLPVPLGTRTRLLEAGAQSLRGGTNLPPPVSVRCHRHERGK